VAVKIFWFGSLALFGVILRI